MITNCQPDRERLGYLRECMETYGQEGNDPDAEWPWNCLSRKTVAYSCGAIRRGNEPVVHNHDEAEFARCRRLADEAAHIMAGVEVGMGSESGAQFAPFFIVASAGADNPQTLNPETIRVVFGGTICPAAEIFAEPLKEQGAWWNAVSEDCSDEDLFEEEVEDTEKAIADYLHPWRSLMQWFHTQSEFRKSAFVTIGDSPLDDDNGASVFPRLAIGLTQAGSLAGIAGYVVHT